MPVIGSPFSMRNIGFNVKIDAVVDKILTGNAVNAKTYITFLSGLAVSHPHGIAYFDIVDKNAFLGNIVAVVTVIIIMVGISM